MRNIAYLFKDYLPQNYFLLPDAIYIYKNKSELP